MQWKQKNIMKDAIYLSLYISTRSLQAKIDDEIDELECLVIEERVDIVGGTETWWTKKNQQAIVIPSYKFCRKLREGHSVEQGCQTDGPQARCVMRRPCPPKLLEWENVTKRHMMAT